MAEFFKNAVNKEKLIHLTVVYYRIPSVVEQQRIPLVVTDKGESWQIETTGVTKKSNCNHSEADTRIVLHALSQESAVVVVAKDTNILMLLLYAHVVTNPIHPWFMKIDHEKFIDIAKIRQHFGDKLCQVLPQFHAIIGCDSTLYMYTNGKIKA